MRLTTTLVASTLLALNTLLAACGEDADTDDIVIPDATDTPIATGTPVGTGTVEDGTLTPGPATTTPETTPDTPTPTATPEGGDATAGIDLTQTCESDRYTIDYPEGWHTNSGEVADNACGWFSPDPFEVEPATELLTEIVMYIDPVAYDDVLKAPSIEDASERSETTVDGFSATRIESPSDGPSIEPGTMATHYYIDLGDGETMIATTYDLEDFDYETNRDILDAMIESLTFSGE